jgi:hypothetical protein
MTDEFFRILVAVADPLCPLQPAMKIDRHPIKGGAHEPKTKKQTHRKTVASSTADRNVASQECLAGPASLLSAVADKWWLLFSVRY